MVFMLCPYLKWHFVSNRLLTGEKSFLLICSWLAVLVLKQRMFCYVALHEDILGSRLMQTLVFGTKRCSVTSKTPKQTP